MSLLDIFHFLLRTRLLVLFAGTAVVCRPSRQEDILTVSYSETLQNWTSTKFANNFRERVCLIQGHWNGSDWMGTNVCHSKGELLGAWQSVALLGDSNMGKLVESFVRSSHCVVTKEALGRCDFIRYIGMNKSVVWKQPDRRVEGPTAYGFHNPWCNDAMRVPRQYTCGNRTVEYLPVVYGRSVELQTTHFNTTQQSVAAYLRQSPRDVCIVNVGVHDLKFPKLSATQYLHNTASYLRLLVGVPCRKILWMGTQAVVDVPRAGFPPLGIFERGNERIEEFNAVMTEFLNREGMKFIYGIDVFELSRSDSLTVLKDRAHRHPRYYQTLARIVFG
eukprot:1275922-Rhodomonas_salina.1